MRDRSVANTSSLSFLWNQQQQDHTYVEPLQIPNLLLLLPPQILYIYTFFLTFQPNPPPPSPPLLPTKGKKYICIYIHIQSQAVLTPSLIFVSGQIPHRPSSSPPLAQSASISEKTAACIANVSAILEAAGSSLDKVVKTTVFLTDMEKDFKEMNEEYSKHFTGGERGVKPARSCVEVRKLPLGVEVEIECLALRD